MSIPIGIGIGLSTPSIQKWLEAQGKQRALRVRRYKEDGYNQVVSWGDKPTEFTHYLLNVVIKTTFIGSALGIFSGMLFILRQALDVLPGASFLLSPMLVQ